MRMLREVIFESIVKGQEQFAEKRKQDVQGFSKKGQHTERPEGKSNRTLFVLWFIHARWEQ
jgi:hypothetical protein